MCGWYVHMVKDPYLLLERYSESYWMQLIGVKPADDALNYSLTTLIEACGVRKNS